MYWLQSGACAGQDTIKLRPTPTVLAYLEALPVGHQVAWLPEVYKENLLKIDFIRDLQLPTGPCSVLAGLKIKAFIEHHICSKHGKPEDLAHTQFETVMQWFHASSNANVSDYNFEFKFQDPPTRLGT